MNHPPLSIQRFAAVCVLVLAAALLAGAQEPESSAVKTAGQVYKNLHVLQDVPADQFNPTMRMIAGSLGVECDFCHVKDRSLDDRQTKRTARMMMTMVLGINKNNFGGQSVVTCYTCHRGKSDPVTTPVIPEVNNVIVSPPLAPLEEASKPVLPAADDILAKYVEALGGEKALRKVTSRVITATDDVPTGEGGLGPGTHVEAQYYYKAPDSRAEFIHMPNGITAAGFDGSTGWTQDNKGVVHVDPAPAKRDYAFYNNHYSDFYEIRDLKKGYSQLQVRDIEKVRNRDAYMVVGVVQGDSPERLYFDTQTGLLLRKWVAKQTMFGYSPVEVDYDDYRDAGDGVKIPFLIKTVGTYPSQQLTVHVDKVQDNVPIEASKFTKPASKRN